MLRKIIASMLSAAMLALLCGCPATGGNEPLPDSSAVMSPDYAGDISVDDAPEPNGDIQGDPELANPVIDYIGPDGRDSRLAEMEGQSMIYKSAELVDRVFREKGENVMISPLSVFMAMGLSASGAEGETLEDMESFLGMPVDKFNSKMKNVLTSAKENGTAKLEIANGMWTRDAAAVSPDYERIVQGIYGGLIESAAMDPSTCTRINQWVSDQTHGMIPSVVEDLDPTTVAMLVNALYFDAPWFDPYDDSQVEEGTFHGTDGDAAVSFLSSTESWYMENGQAEAFGKFYHDGYMFVGILPKDEGQFDLKDLDLDGLLSSVCDNYRVAVKLPKFEFESSMELSGKMQEMGLQLPFHEGARFGRMFSDEMDSLWISQIIHKTKIEVTEAGTKAAAATGMSIVANSLMPYPVTKEITLDRPFVFAIIDQINDVPLFVGKIVSLG